MKICDDLASEEVIEALYDLAFARIGPPPIVAAPASLVGDSGNALAIAYAQYLAAALDWEADRSILRRQTVSRDQIKDGWFRLANEPLFYGPVQRGRRYLIADDVCTMGGTMAALRGFIESQGGRVIGCTTLASRGGRHVAISLAETTLSRLSAAHSGRLANLCLQELGHDVGCLTEPEGEFLLSFQSYDAIRRGFDGARDAGNS